jgi:hypothetical protein
LAVGVFAPSSMLTLEGAEALIFNLRRQLEELNGT